jgi:hypothetical protein
VLISNGVGAAPSWASSLTLTGSLTVGGALAFNAANPVAHTIYGTGTGGLNLFFSNNSPGGGNYATISIGNDANLNLLQIASYSSTFTTAGFSRANGSLISAGGPGGLILQATSGLELWTAGAKWWTINTVGHIVGGTNAAGSTYTQINGGGGLIYLSNAGVSTASCLFFINNNGIVGQIFTSGSNTTFATSSDARLKRDRGLARDTSVLEATEIHEYDWIVDGAPGRGVFSQDAHKVLPIANIPGSDERDADGRLVRPWSTDYSKYVPDLIVGWQQHAARIAALEAAVARG